MKKVAKLKLNRETLRLLTTSDLTQAHGQAPTTLPRCLSYTCDISCAGTCDPNACFPTTTFYC
ncbi:MAG TPA: hypothetical protein VF789_00475 [Thermoanaerobaculia bacterium]